MDGVNHCAIVQATCTYVVCNSVRGAQYKYCIVKNSKIPKYSFHKLPFESFRIWPLALWPLPFNFEILVFLVNFWPLSHLLHTVHVLFSFHDFFTTNIVTWSQLLSCCLANLYDLSVIRVTRSKPANITNSV